MMIPLNAPSLPLVVALIALPVALFSAYIAWLIVPTVAQTVVPAVVCAIAGA